MFSYLDESKLSDQYKASAQYMRSFDDPMEEWERIARNRPHKNIDKAYPRVTDGTTASIVQKTPRRIIQQIPTGKVISDSNDWLTHVASFILTNHIIPHANAQYSLIQKCWEVVEKGLIYGSQTVYIPFTQRDGKFCVDMTVPYVKDVKYELGKISDMDSNYIQMEAWYQTKDIEAIIDQENKLKKQNKKYESTWDLKALAEIKDSITTKADQELTPAERKRQDGNKGGVKIVHMFQRGVGATFYSIHPASNTIVRRKVNKDPRGEMPLVTFYAGIDGSNPRGRGYVELVAPLQNMIDSDMQMYQYERALMLAPPTISRGNWNRAKAKLAPNVDVNLGTDPNNSWEVLQRDSAALAQYGSIYGLNKSQLLNLLSSPDTSISSDVGNPNFSKTPQGVTAQQQTMSVDDNYIRKQFESFFQRWAETAINLYFAERSGKEKIQLDAETAAKLRGLPNFDQSMLSDDNEILMDYDTETEKLKFTVDASTSRMKDDNEQVQASTNLLDMVMKYPMLNSAWGGPIDTDELARRIVVGSSIEAPEKVAPAPTPEQIQAKQDAKNKPNQFSPMFDKPSIRINYPDLPPAAQVQLLGNAGVQVGMQDVMGGPVADPNMRGVINPIDDPNMLVPGGQPGQPAIQSTPGQAGVTGTGQPAVPGQQAPMQTQPGTIALPNGASVDAADLVKLYQLVPEANKPDILKMFGLTQQGMTQATQDAHLKAVGQAHSDVSTHAQLTAPPQPPQQPGQPSQTGQEAETPQEDATEPPQQENAEVQQATGQQSPFSPEDQQLIQELQTAGVPDSEVGKALAMLHHGYSDQEIIQMLTQGGQ